MFLRNKFAVILNYHYHYDPAKNRRHCQYYDSLINNNKTYPLLIYYSIIYWLYAYRKHETLMYLNFYLVKKKRTIRHDPGPRGPLLFDIR